MTRLRTAMFFESHSGFFDGAQRSLALLVEGLDRARFRPVFVGPVEGALTRRLDRAGVRTLIVPLPPALGQYGGAVLRGGPLSLIRRVLAYASYTRQLVGIIRRESVEIVHCNSIRSLLTVGLAGRIARVPLVWHLRLNLELGWWNRLGLWLADRVIVVSDSLRLEFPGGPGDPAHFVTVHNGMDLTAVDSGEAPAHAEAFEVERGWRLVGTVGTLNPRKAQLDLLQAIARVREDHPRVRLVIVGEPRGPEGEAYAERLLAYVKDAGLQAHVIFTGWRTDVSRILRCLDVFVLPSLNEGLPRAILEAMAVGLPVVATRAGGNAELVRDGETGLLVPPADVAALAGAIARLLADPELALRMGRRGQERIETHFSLRASVRGVETVMEALLERRRSPRPVATRGAAATTTRG